MASVLGMNVGRGPTEGFSAPVRVAGRPIIVTAELTVLDRGVFWLPVAGSL